MVKTRVLPEFYFNIADGGQVGTSVIHKFGRAEVGTTYVPVAFGGIYRTPQPAGATKLRVKAGNANDTAAGSGAREVTIFGIDASGNEVTETLATNGTSAGASSVNDYIRLYRFYVSKSGTYASQSIGSHAGDVTVERIAGGEDWGTMQFGSFARSQSDIAAYTVPNGFQALIKSIFISVDSTKSVDVIGFLREGILDTAAPYSAMRMFLELKGVSGRVSLAPTAPLGPYPANTDFGFMAKVASSTGEIDVDFEIILEPS